MSRIPQSFIDDLLTRIDIVDVIDRRVKLKRTGKNYSACCPFHDEKTPSFTVSPDKQFYYCFGCGASGNAMGFLMEYERQGFVDAIESLAQTAGLEVPRETNRQDRPKQNLKYKKLYELTQNTSLHFQQQLKQHPQRDKPVNYLKNRGLTGVVARNFCMGYAPPGWDNLLTKLGTNEEQRRLLIDAGLLVDKPEEKKLYDRFRHRIMFPIRDIRGRVIGFGGRVLGDDKPKYLNSPETDIFHKGRELYGLYEARQSNRNLENLIVVEGYMDVIALAQYGITNAVATLGTACGEDHLKLAFRFVSEVIFCFDGDKAGRTAARRAMSNCLSSMEDGRQIKFLFLAEGQDPDTLVRQIGTDRFNALAKDAVPLEEFLFEVAADNLDTSSMEGRARFSKIAAPLVGQLPEGVYRQLMFDNLAKRTGLAPEILRELQQEKVVFSEPEESAEHKASDREHSPAATPQSPHQQDVQGQPPEDYSHIPAQEGEPPGYAPPPDHYPDQQLQPPGQANTHFSTAVRKSTIELNPTKAATILLLEHPGLLAKLGTTPDIDPESDVDAQNLIDIIEYVKKRPESSFHNILGFWGGAKGIEEQQKLAKLMANQLLGDVKTVTAYDPLKALNDAFFLINKNQEKAAKRKELNELMAKGLENLNDEEKNRYRKLILP